MVGSTRGKRRARDANVAGLESGPKLQNHPRSIGAQNLKLFSKIVNNGWRKRSCG